jgi:hypothetical protein
MSKIAEKKAEKLFPLKSIDGGEIEAYFNAGQLHKREIYIECYDQAMQDFLEKACKWLIKHNRGQLVTQFKNYMQDEM